VQFLRFVIIFISFSDRLRRKIWTIGTDNRFLGIYGYGHLAVLGFVWTGKMGTLHMRVKSTLMRVESTRSMVQLQYHSEY
jgi:hypothetical protein